VGHGGTGKRLSVINRPPGYCAHDDGIRAIKKTGIRRSGLDREGFAAVDGPGEPAGGTGAIYLCINAATHPSRGTARCSTGASFRRGSGGASTTLLRWRNKSTTVPQTGTTRHPHHSRSDGKGAAPPCQSALSSPCICKRSGALYLQWALGASDDLVTEPS
jgi:hypothetical protein